MLTTGNLLKQKREEKGLSLEQVEKVTRIRKKYLLALEKGNLDSLPGLTYLQGFVKNYARYLGLPVENILAVLRREYEEKRKKEIVPQGLTKPLLTPGNFLQKMTIPLTFLLALIIFSGYLYYQYWSFGSLPNVTIDFPPENYVSSSENIEIKGSTGYENRLFINGQEITVENDGSFSLEMKILQGKNTIIITGINKIGKEKKIEKVIEGNF